MPELRIPRALIVEDEEAIRLGIERMFERLGYIPTGTSNAAEALAALEQQHFDVMLIDINLPDASGHLVMSSIGKVLKTTPIIAMSAAATVDDLVLVLRRHAVDFLNKPFRISELESALQRARAERKRQRLLASATSHGAESAPHPTEDLPSPPSPETSTPFDSRLQARPARSEDAPSHSAAPTKPARPPLELLKEQIRDETLSLPVQTDLLSQLQELLQDETRGVEEIVELVNRDPVVSGQLLKLANSGYYRRATPINTLRDACMVLGNRKVLSLAQEVAVSQLFQLSTPPWRGLCRAMWNNVTVTAYGARVLAEQLDFAEPEEAFLAALFHNIGEVVLLHGFCALDPGLDDDGMPSGFQGFSELVQRRHEKVGGRLLRSWGCPPVTVSVARQHHPSSFRPRSGPEAAVSACVLAAWHGAIRAGFPYFGGADPTHPNDALRRLKLKRADVDAAFKDARKWLA